jgi:hypothetical protein
MRTTSGTRTTGWEPLLYGHLQNPRWTKKLHMATPTSKPFSAIIFRISSPPKKSEKQLTFSVMILVAILASIGTLSGLVLNGK